MRLHIIDTKNRRGRRVYDCPPGSTKMTVIHDIIAWVSIGCAGSPTGYALCKRRKHVEFYGDIIVEIAGSDRVVIAYDNSRDEVRLENVDRTVHSDVWRATSWFWSGINITIPMISTPGYTWKYNASDQ